MIPKRAKSERAVIECVGQPLDWPVKIRSGRVRKKKMLKSFGNQAPAPDKRIALDQRGVVPDKPVSQRGRVGCENNCNKNETWNDFFHRRNWIGQKQ